MGRPNLSDNQISAEEVTDDEAEHVDFRHGGVVTVERQEGAKAYAHRARPQRGR